MDISYINDNIILAIFFIILSFSFWCLRIFYTNRVKFVASRDNFTFFNLIKNYKDNNHGIPKNLNQYIFRKNVYPCFLSWVLSFVPMKYNIKILDKYFNHFIDYIQFSLLFFIAFFLTRDPLISFLGSILFIFSPAFLLYKSRTFLLSSRALGNLLVSIFMIFSFLFIKYNYTPYAFILVFLVAMILLSHRYASQVSFFLSLFLVIVYDLKFIIFFMFGIILALLLSKGFYIQILKGHIGQLYYFKKSDNKNDMVKGESEFLKMIKFLINPLKNKEKIKNRIAFGIAYNPSLLFLPYAIYYVVNNDISYIHNFYFFLLWSIFCLLLMLFTSFKITRFLGQQDRYLEYSLIALPYLSSYILIYDFSMMTLGLYLLILIISISINLRYYFSKLKKKNDEKIDLYEKSKKELITFINGLTSSRMVTIPMNLGHEIIFLSKHKVLFNAGAMDTSTVKIFIDICPYFPYPDIQKVKKKYGIKYLIIEKNSLDKMKNIPETNNIFKSVAEFKKIFDNKNFLVYVIGA